jgi:hypothetical protein
MILETVACTENGWALTKAQQPRNGEANGDTSTEATGREVLERLLASMDDMDADPT